MLIIRVTESFAHSRVFDLVFVADRGCLTGVREELIEKPLTLSKYHSVMNFKALILHKCEAQGLFD